MALVFLVVSREDASAPGKGNVMEFQAVVREFLEEQAYKGNSPRTVAFYEENLRRFVAGTGIVELAEFNASLVRTWLASYSGLSRSSVRTYDRALRVFSNWLYRQGYLEDSPVGKLPRPKVPRTEITVFTLDDIRRMLDQAAAMRNPLRDKALVILLLDTGIRIGEVCNLSLVDINWMEGSVRVDGKTGERVVPFGRKAKSALKAYVERERRQASPSVQRVFLSNRGTPLAAKYATGLMRRLACTAGTKASKKGPHTFRHTFAVEFIRAGGDAFSLQRLLGHTTLDMTRRYVHLADSDLRSAHRKFGPGDRLL